MQWGFRVKLGGRGQSVSRILMRNTPKKGSPRKCFTIKWYVFVEVIWDWFTMINCWRKRTLYLVRGLTVPVSILETWCVCIFGILIWQEGGKIHNHGHQNNRRTKKYKEVEPIEFMENSDGFSALNFLINSRESSHFDEKRYNSTQITPEGR